MPVTFHHVAAVTRDAEASAEWYRQVFELRPNWTLETFAQLTLDRLPGLKRIDELVTTGFRIHLMEMANTEAARPADFALFQHACFAVDTAEELERVRDRAAATGSAVPPTEIITDDDGVRSCYLTDPDGLEWEVTWIPADADGR